jgi:hypothetical protein
MFLKRYFLAAGLIVSCAGLQGQQALPALIADDSASLTNLKRLTLPAGYSTKPLPSKKDNTRLIYFPGIYNQYVWNCNQASSIWTMFTYEINYLRGLNSTVPDNQYSPMAVFNHLNYGNPSQGVSYFDSWKLVEMNGIPGHPDYPADNQNWLTWMTGYDRYYRGMKNRVDEVFAIDVGSPEGLLTLKHWLHDHLEGSQVGGLANFQIGSGDMIIPQIPLDKGLEEEGQYIVIRYGPYVGHAMTFAGWNDSVRYDYNGDGRYTNNIDINGDGAVSMLDWEIGAMLVVNSWGSMYNAGKLWVMYRLLAETTKNGGIWDNAAMVVKPRKTYEPLLTVKAGIRYNQRSRLKIQVGIASSPEAASPERIMDFPCFNFQGDTLPMQGFVGVDSDLIEIGLDITPMLNYFPENGQAKLFLEVVQKSPDGSGYGQVESFSVMDYTHGTFEFRNNSAPVMIRSNDITRLSVPVSVRLNKPVIVTDELPDADIGADYRYQIIADGTTGPYRYTNPVNQFQETTEPEVISLTGGQAVFQIPSPNSHRTMDLPFGFPFYGSEYTRITILTDGGFVMGPSLVPYPYVIDNRLRFYQYNGVFPFMGSLNYTNPGHQVTFETSSDQATIRWHAAADPAGEHSLEFAARLHADGRISFYYGEMDVPLTFPWISGVSAGNNLDFHLMGHTGVGVRPNTAFRLALNEWPAWLQLGSNGDLKGTPDTAGAYVLPLQVTDWNGISSQKDLTLTVKGASSVTVDGRKDEIQLYPNPATDRIWIRGYATNPAPSNSLYMILQVNSSLPGAMRLPRAPY